jgi:hypothetical protein
MALDFKKIIDFLQPTYAQLKGLLVMSLGTIAAVYVIGTKVANFQATMKKTYDITLETRDEVKQMKIDNKNDINKLYLDVLDLDTRNNTFWNNKFNILIDYGQGNKSMLKDILKIQDEQQKLYEQDRLKNMQYWNTTIPLQKKPDSSSVTIKKIIK